MLPQFTRMCRAQFAAYHSIPTISTGAYRFPVSRAAGIAVEEIRAFLSRTTTVETVTIVCFDDLVYRTYLQVLGRTEATPPEQ